jgi:hypothetical protein
LETILKILTDNFSSMQLLLLISSLTNIGLLYIGYKFMHKNKCYCVYDEKKMEEKVETVVEETLDDKLENHESKVELIVGRIVEPVKTTMIKLSASVEIIANIMNHFNNRKKND